MNTFKRLINDESGATAIEYGLLAALLSVMVIAGAKVAGGNLNKLFDAVGKEMQDACKNSGSNGVKC